MGVSDLPTWEGFPAGAIPHIGWSKSHLYHLNPVIFTGSRATDWREEWWVRGAGRAPLRLLGSCAGSPRYPWRTFPIFSMWFRKRSRGRAPVDGRKRRRRASGSDGRDGHEGFFRHPLGWHPLGRASAGGPEMPDGRPPGLYSRRVGFRCGTWSFSRLGEASVRASVAAATSRA